MNSLTKPSENVGGYLKVWAVPPSDIVIDNDTALLVTSDNVLEIYSVPESIQFIQQEQQSKAGFTYQAELVTLIPKDCPANDLYLTMLQGKKWILILLDQNEQYKVSGTNDIPHRFSCTTDPGKAFSDLNAHAVSFHSTQTKKAFFIPNPF